jgi:hypothetical protein
MRTFLSASAVAVILVASLFGQQAPTIVLNGVSSGVSDSLYNLALQSQGSPQFSAAPYQPTEMIQKHGPLIESIETVSSPNGITAPVSNPVTQSFSGRAPAATPLASFEGPGLGMTGFSITGAHPDPTLAVGPSHIVAWVNSQYAIFDKNGNALLPGNGFVNGNTLFTGVGNLCETTNRGDPIVAYDRMAQRWVLTQFAFAVNASGNPITPYLQCIAVSTTNNPLGAYVRYTVDFSTVGFNDYGKIGVWPDGYYTTYNIFGGSPAGSNTGSAICASDRVSMIAGAANAATLCAPVNFYAGGASLLPGDLEGATAPTTVAQGNIVMRQSTAPALRILKLLPNYGNSTVTLTDGFGGALGSFVNLPLGATNRACNGAAGACIAQPGTTTKLDTLADRLMYRLAYRNRGGVDSLIVTQSVDPDGAGARSSMLRWYEIRAPFANPPTIFQNANYDPDGSSDRWMGSMAMDKLGNIMPGYSVVNAGTSLKPTIRVTGRLRSELRNQMEAEQNIFTGTGSQTTFGGANTALTRWGDYTTMQVDPADDCTFWYINQYLAADGAFNWHTRISSFKFAGCQ